MVEETPTTSRVTDTHRYESREAMQKDAEAMAFGLRWFVISSDHLLSGRERDTLIETAKELEHLSDCGDQLWQQKIANHGRQ